MGDVVCVPRIPYCEGRAAIGTQVLRIISKWEGSRNQTSKESLFGLHGRNIRLADEIKLYLMAWNEI